jgi:prepilin-type processing-associated H-X9-DG protein
MITVPPARNEADRPMTRTRVVLLAAALLLVAGLLLPFLARSRVTSDRVGCQDHLKDLGLHGVRHAGAPGQELPARPRDELPPGTFLNPTLPTEDRMSWYVYMLNVLDRGPPVPELAGKHRPPPGLAELLGRIDPAGSWNGPDNLPLANYRLTRAICPAQVPEWTPGTPSLASYVALGGLGTDTPFRPTADVGTNAGAYWFDGPTPDRLIRDGLRQTAQIIETNTGLSAWLRGGPGTLRGLDPAATPYLGPGRPFGGCHPGGAYAAMADGSVRFLKDTMDPAVFRALLTRAGGPDEQNFDAP